MTGKGEWLQTEKSRVGLDIGKKFSAVRVVRHWTRLPREAVDAPSIELGTAEATCQVLCSVLGLLRCWSGSGEGHRTGEGSGA